MPEGGLGGHIVDPGSDPSGGESGSESGSSVSGTGKRSIAKRSLETGELLMPKKQMGNEASVSNIGRALLIVAMDKGYDPLMGTGLHYEGDNLVSDEPQEDKTNEVTVTMGTPPQPNTEKGAGGNPYDGMGSF